MRGGFSLVDDVTHLANRDALLTVRWHKRSEGGNVMTKGTPSGCGEPHPHTTPPISDGTALRDITCFRERGQLFAERGVRRMQKISQSRELLFRNRVKKHTDPEPRDRMDNRIKPGQ